MQIINTAQIDAIINRRLAGKPVSEEVVATFKTMLMDMQRAETAKKIAAGKKSRETAVRNGRIKERSSPAMAMLCADGRTVLEAARDKANKTNKARRERILVKISSLKILGKTNAQIASALNLEGLLTRNGEDWTEESVTRAIKRAFRLKDLERGTYKVTFQAGRN